MNVGPPGAHIGCPIGKCFEVFFKGPIGTCFMAKFLNSTMTHFHLWHSKSIIHSWGSDPYTCLFLKVDSMALNFNLQNQTIPQLEAQKALCDQRIHILENLVGQLLPYRHLPTHQPLWNQTLQQLNTLRVHRTAVINRLIALI